MGTRKGGQRGFTIIEVLIVVIIIGVLASLVAPQLRVNAARAKMTEVIGMFSKCRNWITEVYLYETNLPIANEWGCESTLGQSVSHYVDSIQTSLDGIIIATIHGTGDLRMDWHTITLAPLDSSGNLMSDTGRVVRWRCGNAADGTDVQPALLPSSCNGS